MPSLTSLNLVGNYIGKEGAMALAAELKQMPNLTSLNLGYNLIGKEGVTALAAELKQVPNLTSLNLACNDIGKEGAMALAGCLKDTNLTVLGFAGNNIGDEGATALNKALEENCERIKNEVIAFKDNFLDDNNEFKDLKDIDQNTKLEFRELLHKFGKYAFASHIKRFGGLDEEEEYEIFDKLDEIAGEEVQDSSTNQESGSLLANEEGSQLDGSAEEPDFLSAVVEGSQPYPTQNTDLVGEISAGFVLEGLES